MNAIIFHGTKGSPEGNWYFWLSGELAKLGVRSCVPTMPTPEGQSLDNWFATYEEKCPQLNDQTILIGHSCGAVFSMRLLEKISSPVLGTILVAPPLKEIGIAEYDALNSSFLRDPFDWKSIKHNAGKLYYFMGDNDQYVPQDQLFAIAEGLEVKPMVITGGGHLNVETGFTSFPLLLDVVKEICVEAR